MTTDFACFAVLNRSRINVIVLQLIEKEELSKLHKKWWYDKGECIVESDKVSVDLNYSDQSILIR